MHGTVQSTCFGQTDRPLCSISKGGGMHARLAVLDRRNQAQRKQMNANVHTSVILRCFRLVLSVKLYNAGPLSLLTLGPGLCL